MYWNSNNLYRAKERAKRTHRIEVINMVTGAVYNHPDRKGGFGLIDEEIGLIALNPNLHVRILESYDRYGAR
jgi:hypothetical protein